MKIIEGVDGGAVMPVVIAVVMGTVVGAPVGVSTGTKVVMDEAVGTPVGVRDVFVLVVTVVGMSGGTGDVPMDVGIVVGAPVGIILGMTGVSLNVDGYDHFIVDLGGTEGGDCGVGAVASGLA